MNYKKRIAMCQLSVNMFAKAIRLGFKTKLRDTLHHRPNNRQKPANKLGDYSCKFIL